MECDFNKTMLIERLHLRVPFVSHTLFCLSFLPHRHPFLLLHHQHHAVCGPAIATWHPPGSLAAAAERRAAVQEGGALPCFWEGVDWMFPWHWGDSCQEGVPAGVWGLLWVHAQGEDSKCVGIPSDCVVDVFCFVCCTKTTLWSNFCMT